MPGPTTNDHVAPTAPSSRSARSPSPAGGLARALRRAVGLDEVLLARFEGDRRWYTGQLLLVTGVATMATIAMTVALTMTTGQPTLGWPLVLGAAFGAFVAVCDLTIILPDGQAHRRNAWSYAGRLGFSVIMGGLAAMPLTAALFQRDVDHLEDQARQEAAIGAEATYQQQLIGTRTAVHAVHAPAIAAATAARDDAHRQADNARAAEGAQRAECNNEINGTGFGAAGEGPRANAKCAAFSQLAGRVEDTRRRADDTDAALVAAVQAEMADTDTRTAAVPRPQVAAYQPTDLGVIDRISRTHDRLGTVGTAIVTLALMALDTLPVILKLAHGPTTYERILTRRQRNAAVELLTNINADAGAVAEIFDADDVDEAITDDDELERFLHARLIIDPTIQAKALYGAARSRGYERSYPTFTRFLRDRSLRRGAVIETNREPGGTV
jgi:hypothetical protein